MTTIRLAELVDPAHRLGRHVEHDSRSRAYRVPAATASPVSKRWTRRVPIFDQGNTGSCTGNAAVGVLATDPFYDTVTGQVIAGRLSLDENEARTVYSDAEILDGGTGLPGEDNGSTGLSVAKVCVNLGLISGYTHAFSIDDVITGLQVAPAITGITWLTGCDTPDQNGLVRWTGRARGGHEVEVDEIDLERERVGFDNSWSSSWGAAGRFYMSLADYTKALADSGDVTFFTPITQPAPTPTPAPADALATFADVAGPWAAARHAGSNAKMAAATRAFLTAVGASADRGAAHAAMHGHSYRDAGTGRYVTETYADHNRTTTVQESS